MGWYFRLTRWLPVKLLTLGLLVYAVLFHLFHGAVQATALIRAIFAVFGAVSMVFAVLTLVIASGPAVGLLFAPVVLCASQLIFLPTIWNRPTTTARKLLTTGVLFASVYLTTTILAWAGTIAVGWVADLNPCVSYKAGVTGRIPPPPSCQ